MSKSKAFWNRERDDRPEYAGDKFREYEPTTTKTPLCPRCEAKMTVRTNGKSQDLFWGCSQYPECRGSRAIV